MKKISLFLGMALAASLSLTNCTEKIEGPIAPATPAGIPFEISADISTKTTNDGLATQWATGDAINLFHAEAGTAGYVSENDFTLDATRIGVFTGNLSSALDPSKSYDWYAIYPYNKALTTPANNATTAKYFYVGGRSDTPAVQNGNNSTSHLVERYAPLWGKAANVPSNEKPSMIMQHLASVVKVKVTNTTEKPLTVNSVAFTSTEPIVGQFYIDVTGTAVEYTTGDGLFNSSTASLTVKGATLLAKGESAVYYIPIKPHTAASGSILKISVNGYEKPLTLPKDVTFTAGKIKTLAFNFDKVVVDYVTIPWTENFSGDLSLYTLNQSSKQSSDNYAGGIAPELMVKSGGSFSVKVKADAGNYVLTFKSNRDNLTVASSDRNVTVTKNTGMEYLLNVPEGGCTFTLTIKNATSSNARIDDIKLDVKVPVITVDKTTVSAKPEGDKLTLKYSIKYPAADATIAAASPETWVNGFDYGTAGEITFAVDANDGEARTATVTLSYPGAAPVAVTVSQSAKGAVGGSTWNRVSSVNDLLSGGTFIIGYESDANSGVIVPMQNKVTTTTKSSYINSGTSEGNSKTINMSTITNTANYEVTIIASSSVKGAICIKIGDKFIGNANAKNECRLFDKEANTTSFTPTIGKNDVVTLKITANETYHTLQYNTSSPRFAVYGGTQKNVVIYKKNSLVSKENL